MTPHWHATYALLLGLASGLVSGALTWLLLDAHAPAAWVMELNSWGLELLMAAPLVGGALASALWLRLTRAICPGCHETSCRAFAEREGLIYRCPCGAEVDVING